MEVNLQIPGGGDFGGASQSVSLYARENDRTLAISCTNVRAGLPYDEGVELGAPAVAKLARALLLWLANRPGIQAPLLLDASQGLAYLIDSKQL